MSDTELIDALTKSVTVMDSSRRVGWAKQFAAEERAGNAERDFNVAKSERDIIVRHTSFLHGFLSVYMTQAKAQEVIKGHLGAIRAVLDPEVMAVGRRVAADIMAAEPERIARKAIVAAERKARANSHGREFKGARDQERKLLMKRFGIPNEAALFSHLETFGADK